MPTPGTARGFLEFTTTVRDTIWRVEYDLTNGKVVAEPEQRNVSPRARDVLLRMHTTRGYPNTIGAQWIWAVLVDGMALLLLFWAASGLIMWWQLKAVRRSGAVVLALSATMAVALTLGLYRALR